MQLSFMQELTFVASLESSLQIASANDTELAAIRNALFEVGLLVFKTQRLTPLESVNFMKFLINNRPLMTFETTPMDAKSTILEIPAHVKGFPMIRPIGNTKNAEGEPTALFCRTGYEWHKDGDGEGLTMIVCIKTPKSGGNTLFCSAFEMFQTLPDDLKKRAQNCEIVTSNRYTAGGPSAVDCENGLRMDPTGTFVLKDATSHRSWWKLAENRWPLVRTHPVSQRQYISTGGKNLDHIVENNEVLGTLESRELLSKILLTGLAPTTNAELDESYNAPRKLYMMTFNHGCDKNKRIANFGESDAAQKFFSRV